MISIVNALILLVHLLFAVSHFVRGAPVLSRSGEPSSLNANCSSVRLAALRDAMRNTSATGAAGPLDVYVISSADLSGIGGAAGCFARVRYLSGFSGRGANAAVTATEAALWVSSEYFAQVGFTLSELS